MRWKKAGITVGVIAGVFLVMKYAVPVMLPFLLGWLLALAILPAARWLARQKLCRKLHFTEGGVGAVLILLLSVGLYYRHFHESRLLWHGGSPSGGNQRPERYHTPGSAS